MGIVEIKKVNIGDQVYSQMKNQILNGDWKPGNKIPSENQLIHLFGVSRGTVRQAVQKLAGEGLVVTRHGEGSFVQTVGLDRYFQFPVPLLTIGDAEMVKIFEFRGMFESGLAEAAAVKATEEQIQRLQLNYDRMRQEVALLNQYVHSDLDFHLLVSECTQNTLAVQVFSSYEGLLAPAILHMTETIGVGNGVKYHGQILEAIRSRDPLWARAAMCEHLEDNINRFRRMRKLEESRKG